MAGFQAEMADFFVALREAKSTSMLAHLAALRGMSAAEGVEDASLLQELHQACVEQARVWVQQRVPQLVVSFEAHVHGRDRDLLAADHAPEPAGAESNARSNHGSNAACRADGSGASHRSKKHRLRVEVLAYRKAQSVRVGA